MGIQVISIDAGGKINSIVLTDSNNITSEVIDAARELVGDTVYSLEIYTTDNHSLNANNLDINPLGKYGNISGIAEMIARCVALSIKDIQNVKIGFATRTVKVRMGQENAYQSLIDSTFRSLKAAKYTILITLPSSIAASLLVFRFIFPFA
jgi:putative membrane protein